jgi:phosphomevalonate kinase
VPAPRPDGSRPDPDLEPLIVRRLAWPPGLELVLVWSGRPADTPALVSQVRRMRERDPAAHRNCIGALGRAARELSRALIARDLDGIIDAVGEGARAVDQLAARSGAALVPPAYHSVARLAAIEHGAAKPTGAGGGDLIAVFFKDRDDVLAFRRRLAASRLREIPAGLAAEGVQLAGEV